MIASEYGYTFEQIMGMSMREINVAVKYIGIRTNNEYAKNAALHGVKIPMMRSSQTVSKTSDEEQASIDSVMRKLMKRKVKI